MLLLLLVYSAIYVVLRSLGKRRPELAVSLSHLVAAVLFAYAAGMIIMGSDKVIWLGNDRLMKLVHGVWMAVFVLGFLLLRGRRMWGARVAATCCICDFVCLGMPIRFAFGSVMNALEVYAQEGFSGVWLTLSGMPAFLYEYALTIAVAVGCIITLFTLSPGIGAYESTHSGSDI